MTGCDDHQTSGCTANQVTDLIYWLVSMETNEELVDLFVALKLCHKN